MNAFNGKYHFLVAVAPLRNSLTYFQQNWDDWLFRRHDIAFWNFRNWGV